MSSLSIAAYFPFRRAKITGQAVFDNVAMIDVEPDKRFAPICRQCRATARHVHSRLTRAIRDLNLAGMRITLRCRYRKIHCEHCGHTVVEDMGFFDAYQRITRRLAVYVHELCKVLTVKEVAEHLSLDWKTVKNIDKAFLEKDYGETDYEGLRILAVDEIAIRKGHNYMTVVLDYETGRVVWMGENRECATLKAFFDGMTDVQKKRIEAIAMDMWEPFIKAVREAVPHVKIIFDLFHMVSAFGKVIDRVRIDERNKAEAKDRNVFKGSRYLLLRNRGSLTVDQRRHLRELLDLNEPLFTMLILKDKLKQIWQYRRRGWAARALEEWCALARSMGHPSVTRFARRLERYAYGILNHCDYPIGTSRLEGVNNKIKVIKRKAYGYLDNRYFALKVIQAFCPKNDQLIRR